MASSKPQLRDWYSISLDTLRGGLTVIVLVGLALVGYLIYRQYERGVLDRQAGEWISEAMELRGRVESLGVPGDFRADYLAGRSQLEEAQGLRASGDVDAAARRARQSRDLFSGVLDALGVGGPGGQARFLSVSGGVEYRRGSDGPWEGARSRVALRSGDYVKTSGDGSAQIVFGDGTLYTVRANTLFVVTRSVGADGAAAGGEQAIRMEYGWVNLNTSQRPSEIQTPGARARVRQESEASVAYEQGSDTAKFAALRGSIEVDSGDTQREVGALQEVVQEGTRLSPVRPLPPAPRLTEPAENQQFTLEAQRQLTLAWEPVAGATRYALQVSRTREFVDRLLDVDNRTGTSASLGLRAEGMFSWRVAALSRDGAQGPWSAARQFRVMRAERGAEVDKLPPELDLENVKLYGNLVILAGRTEPGAILRINGETVGVDADGTFTKTVQFTTEGWNFVEVRATDAWGNEAERRRRVFVETL